MKKIILSSLLSIFILVVLSIITSIIFSYINYNNGIKISLYIVNIVSIVIFLISGFSFGIINKKQGLLGSILFILVYLLFVLIFNLISKEKHNSAYFIFVICKALTYSIGSIIGVNFKTKKFDMECLNAYMLFQ